MTGNDDMVELSYGGGDLVTIHVTSPTGANRLGLYNLGQGRWMSFPENDITMGHGVLTKDDAHTARALISEMYGKLLMGILH